jgi:hypothetical protein
METFACCSAFYLSYKNSLYLPYSIRMDGPAWEDPGGVVSINRYKKLIILGAAGKSRGQNGGQNLMEDGKIIKGITYPISKKLYCGWIHKSYYYYVSI